MTNDNDIRQGRHCIFLMHVHLVCVTKYRREMFTKAILDGLRSIFTSVCADFEVVLMEFDVNSLKGVRCFQSDDSKEELPEPPEEAMWR